MNNTHIPYFLTHGFRQFDTFKKPSPKNPFWAGQFDNALTYQQDKEHDGTSVTAGVILLKIDKSSVNMFDVLNEHDMSLVMGNYAALYVKCAKRGSFGSFYYMWKHISYYINRNKIASFNFKDYINYLLKAYKINEIVTVDPDKNALLFEDIISYVFKNPSIKVTDKMTVDNICPMLVQNGFNMVHENEDEFDQWFMISGSMLKGKCISRFDVREEQWYEYCNVDPSDYSVYDARDYLMLKHDLNDVQQQIKNNRLK